MSQKNHLPKIFVSHCSDDEIIMKSFSKWIEPILHKSAKIFCTSDVKNNTVVGDILSDTLRKNLKKSKLMIAIITDSYMRSEVCISELSSYWYSGKPVLPIIFNGETGINFLVKIFSKQIIYIDTCRSHKKGAKKLVESIITNGIKIEKNDCRIAEKMFKSFFDSAEQSCATRPYIGSKKEYTSTIQYCQEYGIKKFQNFSLPINEIVKNLKNKDEIYFLGTTCSNIINGLSPHFLAKKISDGANITVLIPNKDSDFITDVAKIEAPNAENENRARLCNEIRHTILNLIANAKNAKSNKSDKDDYTGHLYLGCAFTLIRQTIILGKKKDKVWGFCSLTIPPIKAVANTPSIVFEGSIKKDSMAKIIYEHVYAIRKNAENTNGSAWIEIKKDTTEENIC